jgi:hypothetical protein
MATHCMENMKACGTPPLFIIHHWDYAIVLSMLALSSRLVNLKNACLFLCLFVAFGFGILQAQCAWCFYFFSLEALLVLGGCILLE